MDSESTSVNVISRIVLPILSLSLLPVGIPSIPVTKETDKLPEGARVFGIINVATGFPEEETNTRSLDSFVVNSSLGGSITEFLPVSQVLPLHTFNADVGNTRIWGILEGIKLGVEDIEASLSSNIPDIEEEGDTMGCTISRILEVLLLDDIDLDELSDELGLGDFEGINDNVALGDTLDDLLNASGEWDGEEDWVFDVDTEIELLGDIDTDVDSDAVGETDGDVDDVILLDTDEDEDGDLELAADLVSELVLDDDLVGLPDEDEDLVELEDDDSELDLVELNVADEDKDSETEDDLDAVLLLEGVVVIDGLLDIDGELDGVSDGDLLGDAELEDDAELDILDVSEIVDVLLGVTDDDEELDELGDSDIVDVAVVLGDEDGEAEDEADGLIEGTINSKEMKPGSDINPWTSCTSYDNNRDSSPVIVRKV